MGWQGTLLAHTRLAVRQNPLTPLSRAALQPLIPHPVPTSRSARSQVQKPAIDIDGLFKWSRKYLELAQGPGSFGMVIFSSVSYVSD